MTPTPRRVARYLILLGAVSTAERRGSVGIEIQSWAWRQKLNPATKLVFVKLAESANDETGQCWPSLRHIASRCDMAIRTVRFHIHKLKELGLISVEERYRDDGTQTSNNYKILTPTVQDVAMYPAMDDRGTRQPIADHEPELEPDPSYEIHKRVIHISPSNGLARNGNGFERNGNGFETFWEQYPRKKKKGDARKAWIKIHPDPDLIIRIMKAVEDQKQWEEWLKDNGKYIPYPATWLNSESWNDETKPNETIKIREALDFLYGK